MKVVLKMENNKSLLTTAILSYVWLEKKMDNVDLLTPFVKYIIGRHYQINDEIDCDYIIKELEDKYAFQKLPLVLLKKILNRMSKDNIRILKMDYGKYYLLKDLTNDIEHFENKEHNAKQCINELIDNLTKYLYENKIIDNSQNKESVEQALMNFLEENGFVIIHNPDNAYKWSNKNNILNYNICKYLIINYEQNSKYFQYFMQMIEGFMLANVLYIQFDNNINQKFNGVEVYIDAPLLLRILGYKSAECNRMASELLTLLKKQNAIIKCFEHNYKEVETIIEGYKFKKFNRFNKQQDKDNKFLYEQTLELFDEENFSESDIELILMDLRSKISKLGISIVSTPDLSQNIKYNINVQGMIDYIQSKYTRKAKNITVYNDVISINAINIIRKGKKYPTIEQSKAVFVTLNYALERYVNEYLSINNYNDVGLCINDTHLTSILWVKNNNEGNKLAKAKILSSILAGFNLSNNMIEKVRLTLLKLEKYSPTNVDDIVNKIITSQTSHILMEITGGDINKISEENILNALENDKNKEIEKHLKTLNKVEKELNNLKNNELERAKNKNELINFETKKILTFISYIFWAIYIVIILLIILLYIYIVKIETNIISKNFLIKTIIYVSTFFGYFSLVYALISLKKFTKFKNKVLNKLELKIVNKKEKKYSKI